MSKTPTAWAKSPATWVRGNVVARRFCPPYTSQLDKLGRERAAKMPKANGQDLPFLVAGGGIGGLVTAYALAHKGFPVRVFEQAPEFKELGAGIQLGPNIFRAIERIGLKTSMLDDA